MVKKLKWSLVLLSEVLTVTPLINFWPKIRFKLIKSSRFKEFPNISFGLFLIKRNVNI